MKTVLKVGQCKKCDKTTTLIVSNNPLVPSYCESCLSKMVSYKNMKQVAFFCRTYNIPLLPDRWIAIADEVKEEVFRYYVEVISQEFPETQYNNALKLRDYWDDLDAEWEKVRTHRDAIRALAPIKEEFLLQMQVKWGQRFTFEQFLHLENLYTNTLRTTGITDPLKKDLIKKIAIISVDMETKLAEGDVKSAKDFSSMHKTYAEAAGIDGMVELTDDDVIGTVSQLCQYIEDQGFKFNYYDNVERDIVDKTIADIKEWYRNFVGNATGLQQTYETIEKRYRQQTEDKAFEDATERIPLDDLLDQYKEGSNAEVDAELEDQNYNVEVEDLD